MTCRVVYGIAVGSTRVAQITLLKKVVCQKGVGKKARS